MTIHETDDPDPENIGEQKKRSIYLISFLFFLLILVVPLFWLIRGNNPQDYSLIEDRNLKSFTLAGRGFPILIKSIIKVDKETAKEIFSAQFIRHEFQNDLEKSTADQFPFRLDLIKTSKAIDRLLINLVYGSLPDAMIPADMQSDFYVTRDKSLLNYGPNKYDDSVKNLINNRIENYETLIVANPKIKFYAFFFERFRWSKYHPLDSYFPEADHGQTIFYFEENKPQNLNLGKMMFSSFEDQTRYFYRTDHHWNTNGIIQAYYGIHNLLAQNFLEISPPIEFQNPHTFPDIKFLGYFARESLYPIRPDEFDVVIYDLPPYKLIKDGQEIAYTKTIQYLNGDYSTEPYVNHYKEYYGEEEAFLEYVFENGSDRNLLLIGSSFDNPLQPLIASHYRHTYSIDLRVNKNFSLSKFLSSYKIDDLLIIGSNIEICYATEWIINP